MSLKVQYDIFRNREKEFRKMQSYLQYSWAAPWSMALTYSDRGNSHTQTHARTHANYKTSVCLVIVCKIKMKRFVSFRIYGLLLYITIFFPWNQDMKTNVMLWKNSKAAKMIIFDYLKVLNLSGINIQHIVQMYMPAVIQK